VTPILRVALEMPLRRLFDYVTPRGVEAAALVPGQRVRVPFGRRRRVGVLIELAEHSAVPAAKLKTALEILDREPVFDRPMLEFLLWAAGYYHHPVGEVLAAALPQALRDGAAAHETPERWQLTRSGRDDAAGSLGRRGPRLRALIGLLAKGVAGPSELISLGPR
jgi:primosomal protein N' (replication factor Y)